MKALLTTFALLLLLPGCYTPQAGGRTTPASGHVCEVHHCAMRQQACPILYGMPVIKPGYLEAKPRSFPHAGPIFGGCVLSENAPRTKVVDRCPMCVAAEARWSR